MECGFVGVHLGAGHHSQSKTEGYFTLCKEACKIAIELLRKGETAVNSVTKAVEILENSPLTNAGIGSNLNDDETVECDAGLMDGDSLTFGAVGAVRGIKNPILIANAILKGQLQAPHPLGIIPPCFLVGPPANKWASQHGIISCEDAELITEESSRQYKHYRKRLTEFELGNDLKKIRKLEDVCNIQSTVLDTVGAIVMDKAGNVAAAASSGGLILKRPGRIGQAAIYGSGFWAQNNHQDCSQTVAITTSGCGEYLIKTNFAKTCADHMLSSEEPPMLSVKEAIQKKYLDSPFLKKAPLKLVGILGLLYNSETKHGDFLWSHTTDTMCLGYMSINDKKPVARLSSLPSSVQQGTTIKVEGISI